MRLDSIRELKAQLGGPSARTWHEPLALGASPVSGGDYRLAVRVQDRALLRDARLGEIERAAAGELDVRFVGRIVKREAPFLQARHRPLLIGSSVGHVRVTAGTIGAFVSVDGDDRPRILSNNHVLADENRGAEGDAVLQPGAADGGRDPADVVAALDAFVALAEDAPNAVDAAIAVVAEGIAVQDGELTGVGTLGTDPLAPEDVETVGKLGRTTGRTTGRVTAFELDNVIVAYDAFPTLRFDDQIEIEGTGSAPFSQGGDSGSLIWDEASRRPVGLLFAGGEEGDVDVTYANPIGAVLGALGARLRT
jgi:hypothetical protein